MAESGDSWERGGGERDRDGRQSGAVFSPPASPSSPPPPPPILSYIESSVGSRRVARQRSPVAAAEAHAGTGALLREEQDQFLQRESHSKHSLLDVSFLQRGPLGSEAQSGVSVALCHLRGSSPTVSRKGTLAADGHTAASPAKAWE